MSGEELCTALEQLDIVRPGEISSSDIDWTFMAPDSAPLATFFSWLSTNVNSADVLTEKELQQLVSLLQFFSMSDSLYYLRLIIMILH